MAALTTALLATAACEIGGNDGGPVIERRKPAELQSAFAELTVACFAADMSACDEIASLTANQPTTSISSYGETCGGRLPQAAAELCVEVFPEAIPGQTEEIVEAPSQELVELASECELGELPSCDELLRIAPEGSAYRDYAASCGGRSPPDTDCVARLLPSPSPAPEIGGPLADRCVAGSYSACDELAASSSDEQLLEYGRTCGGRMVPVDSCVLSLQESSPGASSDGLEMDLSVPAHACLGSDMIRCDELAALTSEEILPAHHVFGATCGGRLEERIARCTTDDRVSSTPPAVDPPPDPVVLGLRRLAERCFQGRFQSCARLARSAGPGYEQFREYGESCGDLEAGPPPQCSGVGNDPDRETGTTIGATGTSAQGTTEGATLVTEPRTPSPQTGVPTPVTEGVTVIVDVPDAPPPAPTEPVPAPYKAHDEVLRAVFLALQHTRQTQLLPSDGLRLDQTTDVTVEIVGVVPIDISRSSLQRVSRGRTIDIVIPVHLEGSEVEFASPPKSVRLELEATSRPVLIGATIGTFSLKPLTAGAVDLRMVVSHPEMDRAPIPLDYEIQLGEYDVADKPWLQRVADAILAGGELANAGKAIFLVVAGVVIWLWRKGRGRNANERTPASGQGPPRVGPGR